MQRGIINKVYIRYFMLLGFLVYDAIAVIYLYLPPMFGFLSLYFYQALDEDDRYFIYTMVGYFLFFEANRDFLLFSTSLFLLFSYFYFIPKIRSITTCKRCLYPVLIPLSYIGYFLFMLVINFIFNLEHISFDYIVVYYIVIEIIIALVWL